MGATGAVVSIIAALAGTAASIKGMTDSGPSAPKVPDPAALARQDQEQQRKDFLTRLPGIKADWASRIGGGMSPEFLAGVGGASGQGLDVLQQIRESLNVQAP